MYNPNFLTLSRHGFYYFRFPIPAALHPYGKRSDIKLSLQTRCPREALHLARALGYAANLLLASTRMQDMEYQAIRDVLHEHFKGLLERHKQRLASQGRLSLDHVEAVKASGAFAEDALKYQYFDVMGTESQLSTVISAYAMDITKGSADYDTLRTEYLRAARDYSKAVVAQDAQLDSYDFALPTPLKVIEAKTQKKLAAMIKQYCDSQLELKHWTERTGKNYRRKFDLLLRFLGEDASLDISDEVAADVKIMLQLIPKNPNKFAELKGLSIKELMGLNLPVEKRLSPVTVAGYLRTYSTFYEWKPVKKTKVENNFSYLIDDVSNAHVERDPFTLEQTKLIMDQLLVAPKPHMKWGMMIAFYTGARVNEIAQLYAEDIVEVDGVKCFRFTNELEDQSLKNKASRRTIPIHSRLKELGFLEYAHKIGKGRLFPALPYEKNSGGYGRRISAWVNDSLLKRLGIKTPKLVFHSTRHTLAQQLRNNKIPESTIREIIGHAQSGTTFVVYANKLDKKIVQEALETVKYL